MGILDRLLGRRPVANSAAAAKNRLKFVLIQDNEGSDAPDFLPAMKKEILAVVARYLDVDNDMIKVELEKIGDTSVLEINVEMDKARIRKRQEERAAKPDSAKR